MPRGYTLSNRLAPTGAFTAGQGARQRGAMAPHVICRTPVLWQSAKLHFQRLSKLAHGRDPFPDIMDADLPGSMASAAPFRVVISLMDDMVSAPCHRIEICEPRVYLRHGYADCLQEGPDLLCTAVARAFKVLSYGLANYLIDCLTTVGRESTQAKLLESAGTTGQGHLVQHRIACYGNAPSGNAPEKILQRSMEKHGSRSEYVISTDAASPASMAVCLLVQAHQVIDASYVRVEPIDYGIDHVRTKGCSQIT